MSFTRRMETVTKSGSLKRLEKNKVTIKYFEFFRGDTNESYINYDTQDDYGRKG